MNTTAVKERSILFSGPMVRAILAGRKTQTRRPVKNLDLIQSVEDGVAYFEDEYGDNHKTITRCPYGQPGDRLWVRETWGMDNPEATKGRDEWEGPPNQDSADVHWKESEAELVDMDAFPCGYWRSPATMPKWAARIWLEITNVRVERIQDISDDDIWAEGASFVEHFPLEQGPNPYRYRFRESYNAIYPGSWDRNDWVWVIEFKR